MKRNRKLSLRLDELRVESFETEELAEARGTVHGAEAGASGATCNEWTCPAYNTCQCGSVYDYPYSCRAQGTLCIW